MSTKPEGVSPSPDDLALVRAGVDAKPTTAPGVTPDEPIRSSSQDKLNRTGFAAELARAIMGFEGTDSVVVGVHGRWGTGKSSLLNLLAEQLDKASGQPPLIFRFNPWGFSDQEQLTARFFGELAAFLKLHVSIPSLVSVSDNVEEYGELLSPLARFLFPRAAEALGTGWKWYRRYLNPTRPKTVAELKARINSGLREANRKLIIMIDDIDRLDAGEIRQSFQLVKLNANFSNTVYVVAFDKGLVVTALKDVAPGRAGEYLEKIVQVSFNLPPISESTLTDIIVRNFNELIEAFSIPKVDDHRFANMFASGFRNLFKTIRDVNRYFNVFRFALGLMWHDTDFVDLAAIQAVALFCPEISQQIQDNSDLFKGGWSTSEQTRQTKENLQPRYDSIFEVVHGSLRESLISLCKFLFPKMEHVYGALHSTYGSDWESNWSKHKRIASSKYFPYYFQLAVPDTDVRQSELDAAIQEASSVGEFAECLRRYRNSKRFAAFVDLLRERLSSLPHEKRLIVLGSIFVVGDEIETDGFLLFGLVSEYLRFGMWLLLDVLDSLGPAKFECLRKAMWDGSTVFTTSDTTAMFDRVVQGNPDSARLKSRYPELTDADVRDMKSCTISKIEQAAQDGKLASVPQLAAVLYRWQQWGNPDRAKGWVTSTLLKSPAGAARMVEAFARTISAMSSSDRAPRVRLAISLKDIGAFADVGQLADLLSRTRDEDLTERQREAKARFLTAKAELDKGGDPDSRDPFFDEDN